MMRFRILFFSLLMSLIASVTFSQSNKSPVGLGNYKYLNGKKFVLHKVQSKETWAGISKKYKVSVAYLKASNKGVAALKHGQIINIPTEDADETTIDLIKPETKKEIVKTAAKDDSRQTEKYKSPLFHTVSKGETIYSISKKYNQDMNDIRIWNKIVGNSTIKLGQQLMVGYEYKTKVELIGVNEKKNQKEIKPAAEKTNTEKEIPKIKQQENIIDAGKNNTVESPQTEITKPINHDEHLNENTDNTSDEIKNINVEEGEPKPAGEKSIHQITETGIGAWIQDGEINQNKYYALHRSAPVGTIIKVTNRMNQKYVFVKVVGKLPDTGDNENIIVKLSQAASSKMGVLDSRFQVELNYGVIE